MTQAKVDGGDVQVIGIDPENYLKVAAFDWNAGSSDAALDQLRTGRWLIANGIYAAQHNLVVGQAVLMDTPTGPRTYHLAGIGNDYLNAKLSTLYASQDNLQRDFNVTADLLLMANRTPSADPAATKQRLARIVGDYPAFRLYESATWRAEQMQTFSQSIIVFDVLIAALALPSLLALMNTLAISVLARTREIGMLRAVGATRRQVRRMVMAESLLLSVIGTGLGAIAGLWLGYALVAAMGPSAGRCPTSSRGRGCWPPWSSASPSASLLPSDRRARRPASTWWQHSTRSEYRPGTPGGDRICTGDGPNHGRMPHYRCRQGNSRRPDERSHRPAGRWLLAQRTPGQPIMPAMMPWPKYSTKAAATPHRSGCRSLALPRMALIST